MNNQEYLSPKYFEEYRRTAGHPPAGVPLTSTLTEDMRPVIFSSGAIITKAAKQ